MLGAVVVQLADHLVGRAGELDRLEVKLQELEDGQPGAVELIGAPGIGKSRLLGALAERAEALCEKWPLYPGFRGHTSYAS